MTPYEWYYLVCFVVVMICFGGVVWLGILTVRDSHRTTRIQKRLNETKD